MEKDPRPANWDWVTERHKCSVAAFFERLRAAAEQNVQARKALRFDLNDTGPVEFSSTSDGFSVTRSLAPDYEHRVVRFTVDGRRIRVEGAGVDVKFDGVVTLNDQGECRLSVNAQDLDEWQVLKRALEILFFDL